MSDPTQHAMWREFDYDRKAQTAPEPDRLVYVHEIFYHGVEVGFFDGYTFRMWWGTDDCSVSHWAPMEQLPAAPEGKHRGVDADG